MNGKNFLFDRQTWGRFIHSLKMFASSKRKHEGTKAVWLFVGLIAFMFGPQRAECREQLCGPRLHDGH